MNSEGIVSEICIIGAGPSGAITSLFLSKLKVPHVILDSAEFPRDKICGDALDLKVLRVLNHLNPDIVENEILKNPEFLKARGCSVLISKNKKFSLNLSVAGIPQSDYPFFVIAKRAVFDNFLANKISSEFATFHQGTKVVRLERMNDLWHIYAQKNGIEMHIKSYFLVGADGDHSVLLRYLGSRKIERSNYAAAIRQYWKGISGFDNENHLEIYLPSSLPLAYLWIFPLPNGEANVGCGLASDFVSDKKINLKNLFQDLIKHDPVLKERFMNAEPLEEMVGWGLPLASHNRKCAGEAYLLVGDAASLIDPTTGEGVGPGMMSGMIAAHFIQRAYIKQDYSGKMFQHYEREIKKRLKPAINRYRLLRIVSPHLYNFLINFFSKTGIASGYFKRSAKAWLNTAKFQQIEINFD